MTSMLLTLALAAQVASAASAAPDHGSPLPPVEIVLYSDFQCPYCAQFSQPFRELQTKGIDVVKTTVKFKNFPLVIHPNAQIAHRAAMTAKAHGKFWWMYDLHFSN